jgi:hypothetical protein
MKTTHSGARIIGGSKRDEVTMLDHLWLNIYGLTIKPIEFKAKD